MDDSSCRLAAFDCSGSAAEVSRRWKKWHRSFDYMVKARDIKEAQRLKNLLLHHAGTEVQDLYDDLEDPLNESDRPSDDNYYTQCLRILNKHFEAPANHTFERHIFRQMMFQPGETMSQFAVRLRQQANLCSFGDSCDEMIRDQIIAAVPQLELKKKLLETVGLTLAACLQQGAIFEATKQQVSLMSPSDVHAVTRGRISFRSQGQGRAHASPGPTGERRCFRCNRTGHLARDPTCPARDQKCSKCSKVGHLAVCCRSQNRIPVKAHTVGSPDAEEETDSAYYIAAVGDTNQGMFVDIVICGRVCKMEVDTGAQLSIIPAYIWQQSWSDIPLEKSNACLYAYGGAKLEVVGEALVEVCYNSQTSMQRVVVVKGGTHPLLGRDWLKCVRLDWSDMFSHVHSTAVDILAEFPKVFQEGLGTVEGRTAAITLRGNPQPKCCSARPIPYALRDKVDKEIDRLQEQGIIKPVSHADWASPLVVVRKKDNGIRLCADFKITINKYIEYNQHPIPNPTDLLAQLSGGQLFSKLDLSQAYAQLRLDENSQKLCVIATHRGLYAYTRLPFGVSSAPAIWQRTIEQVLQGIIGVVIYFDDILISG